MVIENQDASLRRVCCRLGAMLMDLNNPTRVIARTKDFPMEPETCYERFGSVIPNVTFPTGLVLKDGLISLYYGICDTAVALATARLDGLMARLLVLKQEFSPHGRLASRGLVGF